MDEVAQIGSLPGLIENWRLVRRSIRKGDRHTDVETQYELATAIISVLEYGLMDAVEEPNFQIRRVSKGTCNGLTNITSFNLQEFMVELRVSDTLTFDDKEDEDEDEVGSFKTIAGSVDLFDVEEATVWLDRRIRLHVRHPQLFFFWARVEYEVSDEKPDYPEITVMDNGDCASLGLIRLCEIINAQ